MQVAARPVVMGGSALLASGLIAAAPVVAPSDLHTVSAAVRLLSTDPLGGLENILPNLLTDISNMGYNETQALQEIAYALGPPDSTGGIPGWLPPGLPPGMGVDPITDQYTLGGTGSWWMESLGNTWGWDDGNWPQVIGYMSALLPIQPLTQELAYQVQLMAQGEIIDGASVGCEFECSDVLGYINGWFKTPLQDLMAPGYTYPTILQGTVQDPTGVNVIWSGQSPGQPLDFSKPFTDFFNSLLQDPSQNPLHPFDLGAYLTAQQDAFQAMASAWGSGLDQGSFIYWGADTMYSIPAVIGGLIHSFTGGLVPNEFSFLPGEGAPPDQPLGAEPPWGPTADASHLPQGLVNGAEYVLTGGDGQHGLLGYLDPSTWIANFNTLFAPSTASADLSGLLDPSTLSADLSGLFDPSTLSADLSTLLDPSTISTDLSGLLGPDLASMVASLF